MKDKEMSRQLFRKIMKMRLLVQYKVYNLNFYRISIPACTDVHGRVTQTS